MMFETGIIYRELISVRIQPERYSLECLTAKRKIVFHWVQLKLTLHLLSNHFFFI
jgi:hypothetical protein